MPKAAKAKGAAALRALADAKAALVGLKKQLEALTDAPAFAELGAKVQAAVEKVRQALADAEATVASGAKKPRSKK
jgi:type VI protein secretion system component VasF